MPSRFPRRRRVHLTPTRPSILCFSSPFTLTSINSHSPLKSLIKSPNPITIIIESDHRIRSSNSIVVIFVESDSMAMMIPSCSPTKLYKRINIYSTLIVITLCSIAYLLGSYQRPAVSPSSDDSFLRKSSCSVDAAAATSLSASGFLPLDFASHHRAEDLIIINTTTSSTDDASPNPVHRFPACDVKLSEYTPCEDGKRSLRFPRERQIYRERHCPVKREEKLRCLIPAPHGYRRPVRWPESRNTVWFSNVPHKWLTVEKAGQNWVRFEEAAGGERRFRFPGDGTMFPNGADAYIDEIEGLIGGEFSGGGVRTVVDTGCGVKL